MARPTGHGGVDTPDYGIGVILAGYPAIRELGELAARLGSPSIYDRYGNVIAIEDFKGGIEHWLFTTWTSAADPTLTAQYTIHGYYALNLNVAQIDGSRTDAQLYSSLSSVSNIGLELSFNTSSAFHRFKIRMVWGDGTDKLSAAIELRAADKKIYYFNNVGAMVELGNWDMDVFSTNYWHTLKYVVSMLDKVYLRCSVDSEHYSINNLGVDDIGSNAYPYLQLIFSLESDGIRDCNLAIDRILLTTNEPR